MKWLVAFLGNPGSEYEKSRHNAGWLVSDSIDPITQNQLQWKMDSYADAEVIKTDNAIYIKPQTFMNNSGKSVRYFCDKELITPDHVVIVYDDVDIPVGSFKISFGKGDGNHNGVASVISHIGSRDFVRLRIGVGDDKRNSPLRNFVLGKLKSDDLEVIEEMGMTIADVISDIITGGHELAQNKYNKVPEKSKSNDNGSAQEINTKEQKNSD